MERHLRTPAHWKNWLDLLERHPGREGQVAAQAELLMEELIAGQVEGDLANLAIDTTGRELEKERAISLSRPDRQPAPVSPTIGTRRVWTRRTAIASGAVLVAASVLVWSFPDTRPYDANNTIDEPDLSAWFQGVPSGVSPRGSPGDVHHPLLTVMDTHGNRLDWAGATCAVPVLGIQGDTAMLTWHPPSADARAFVCLDSMPANSQIAPSVCPVELAAGEPHVFQLEPGKTTFKLLFGQNVTSDLAADVLVHGETQVQPKGGHDGGLPAGSPPTERVVEFVVTR